METNPLPETLDGSESQDKFFVPAETFDASDDMASELGSVAVFETDPENECSLSELLCMEEQALEADPTSPPPPPDIDDDSLLSFGPNPLSESWPSWSQDPAAAPLVAFSESYPVEELRLSMVGAGLYNLGNTCFINAILQCITHTVPLVEGLRGSNHPLPCDCGSEWFCVVCALREHVDLSMGSSGRPLRPSKFVDNLNHFSSYFQRYQQEDAHEFLQCFLDKLERSWLENEKTNAGSTFQDKDLVNKVFGGSLVSKLRCCSCGHCSDTREPLIDLSLEIEDADSLPRALESFTKIEKINDSETKFTCENCKEEVSVEKQLVVDEAPLVAAFHLKRFKADGNFVQKIDKHVEFPLELDLKPYTSGNDNNVDLKYELYAIVEHVGFSATSGHYFCFIRSAPDTWHRLDDSKVTRVREEFVLSQEAYILFYARQGTPWFSTLKEQMPCSADTHIMNTSPKSVLDNVGDIFPINIPEGCASSAPRDVGQKITTFFRKSKDEEILVTDTVEGIISKLCDVADKICENIDESERDAGKETDDSTPMNTEASYDTKNNGNRCSTSSYGDTDVHKLLDDVRVAGSPPTTPPRLRSLDTFSSSEPKYHIPRDHLKSEDNVIYRRRSSNVNPPVVEAPGKQAAIRYLTKTRSATRSRRNQLLAAIEGTQEGMNKKRKRVGIMTM